MYENDDSQRIPRGHSRNDNRVLLPDRRLLRDACRLSRSRDRSIVNKPVTYARRAARRGRRRARRYVCARAHTVSLTGILTKREREPEVRSARGGQVRVTTTSPLTFVDYDVYVSTRTIGANSHTAVTARGRQTASSPLPPPLPPIRLHTISVHHL